MTTFETPDPITATLDLSVGGARIIASNREDTLVEVRPSDPSKNDDIKAAEQTRIDYADGRLSVVAPKTWKRYSLFGHGGSIQVRIELPTGSRLRGDSGMGDFDTEGRLGDCRLKTSYGNIRLDETAALDAHSSYGDITVDLVGGDAQVSTSSGDLRVREVKGAAQVKNSNGDCMVGEVTGEVRVKSSNGDITIERAGGSVDAKTANGSILVADASSGSVTLATACGDLELGIREGTAAWLDVSSAYGDVRNSLTASDNPPTGDTVEVHARTSYGDVVIRRSPA
ncbi:MAG: DUF4097 domain-containing protein [Actinomycetota bacterium]|nr:DUF4097 domain-containing protein [Actinomycetota bacterium]